jgi:prepilin-type N-terminal cleavage/methylation domain-containing protein
MTNKLKMANDKWKIQNGFTLVELLVVICIIGIMASIGLVAFSSAQARSRDAQRKSDLKEVSGALELFYSDYGRYPDSSGGEIQACSYDPVSRTGAACTWGTGTFTDGRTTYFKVLPKDKSNAQTYFYRSVTVDSVANSGFQIYARLENSQDSSIISTAVPCGEELDCNFAVTSSNTTP